MESPTLADTLVAWSAEHLSSHNNRYQKTALEARSTALRLLTLSLSSRTISSSEVNAATSLVLMTSEVCLGYHTQWHNHLIGTKKHYNVYAISTIHGISTEMGTQCFQAEY